MTNHIFSGSNVAFYSTALQETYEAAGSWPTDGIDVGDDTWMSFVGQAPSGKMLGQLNGAPVWIDLPPPDPQTVLQNKIAEGVVIVNHSDDSMNGTFSLDTQTMNEVGSVARDVSAGLGLPGDADTFYYPDRASVMHVFTEATIVKLYKAMRNLLLAMNTQCSIAQNGGTPVWPTQTIIFP